MPNETGKKSGLPKCPQCLVTVAEDAHFCPACGAPLTPHAATDPLFRVWSAGYAISGGVRHPESRIVFYGMWLLIGSLFLVNLPALIAALMLMIDLVFPLGFQSDYGFFGRLLILLIAGSLEFLLGFILYRTTINRRMMSAGKSFGRSGKERLSG